MTLLIDEEASQMPCPVARIFGDTPINAHCRASGCILWRWKPIMAGHPLWVKAVRAEAEKLGEKSPFKDASRIVADDPAAFGLTPTEGWCGLGGEPRT